MNTTDLERPGEAAGTPNAGTPGTAAAVAVETRAPARPHKTCEAKKETPAQGPLRTLLSELLNLALVFCFAVLVTELSEWAFRSSLTQTAYFTVHHPIQFWNESFFVFLVLAFLYFVLRRLYLVAFVGGIGFAAASTANYIKLSTRSEPLLPWDFTVIKDAGEIANRVKLHITYEVVLGYVIPLLCVAAFFLLRKKRKAPRLPVVLHAALPVVSVAAAFFLLTGVFMNDLFLQKHDIKEITWSQSDNYRQNGFIFSFLNNLGHRKVVVPADYSQQTVQSAESSIQKSPASAAAKAKPNIIIIQDEALCDLTEFSNVQFSEPVMPEIEALRKTSVSGHLLTPMYGGGTCNSEFEVLTGFTYSYLPNGSVPYEEYFKTPTFSYVSFLKSLGYYTLAVHPFDPTFWDRNIVFPNIGFSKFLSETNFKNPQMKRGFISDLSAMKMIVQQYKANQASGKPYFNFTVTMQNHFSWGKDDYPENERVKLSAPGLTPDESDILTTYATGVREADSALKYLIDYFSTVKQPTIVVIYGDHMPALDDNTLTAGGYLVGDESSALNVQKKHSTPYIIWNNFGGTKAQQADMSMYELIPFIDQTFRLPRPLYFDFLEQQYETYRGYATGVYIDNQNQPVMQMPAGGQEYLQKQELFEYDLLIGNRYGAALTK